MVGGPIDLPHIYPIWYDRVSSFHMAGNSIDRGAGGSLLLLQEPNHYSHIYTAIVGKYLSGYWRFMRHL